MKDINIYTLLESYGLDQTFDNYIDLKRALDEEYLYACDGELIINEGKVLDAFKKGIKIAPALMAIYSASKAPVQPQRFQHSEPAMVYRMEDKKESDGKTKIGDGKIEVDFSKAEAINQKDRKQKEDLAKEKAQNPVRNPIDDAYEKSRFNKSSEENRNSISKTIKDKTGDNQMVATKHEAEDDEEKRNKTASNESFLMEAEKGESDKGDESKGEKVKKFLKKNGATLAGAALLATSPITAAAGVKHYSQDGNGMKIFDGNANATADGDINAKGSGELHQEGDSETTIKAEDSDHKANSKETTAEKENHKNSNTNTDEDSDYTSTYGSTTLTQEHTETGSQEGSSEKTTSNIDAGETKTVTGSATFSNKDGKTDAEGDVDANAKIKGSADGKASFTLKATPALAPAAFQAGAGVALLKHGADKKKKHTTNESSGGIDMETRYIIREAESQEEDSKKNSDTLKTIGKLAMVAAPTIAGTIGATAIENSANNAKIETSKTGAHSSGDVNVNIHDTESSSGSSSKGGSGSISVDAGENKGGSVSGEGHNNNDSNTKTDKGIEVDVHGDTSKGDSKQEDTAAKYDAVHKTAQTIQRGGYVGSGIVAAGLVGHELSKRNKKKTNEETHMTYIIKQKTINESGEVEYVTVNEGALNRLEAELKQRREAKLKQRREAAKKYCEERTKADEEKMREYDPDFDKLSKAQQAEKTGHILYHGIRGA